VNRLATPMPAHETRARLPVWLAIPLGAATGALATAIAALTSPELYIDWGSLPGALVVVPLFSLGAAAAVTIPLAVMRRIAWTAVPMALATSLIVGELVFQASFGTAFARWSAARHWAATERRAAAEREATERQVCRKLLAVPPIPPPPAPPGATATRRAPDTSAGTAATVLVYHRERCQALLER
jgi:hypothetical protein